MNESERRAIGERVQAACAQAAKDGYRDAAMAGLCGEGALEAAIGAIERLDLDAVLHAADCSDDRRC